MPHRQRFGVQDLQVPARRGSSIRPVDGFVNAAQAPPNFGVDAQNYAKAGQAIMRGLQFQARAELNEGREDRQRGFLEGNLDPEIARKLSDALQAAAKGETDPEKIRENQARVIMKMRAEGVLGEEADPNYIIGVRRSEGIRIGKRASILAISEIESLSRIEDESGELIEGVQEQALARFEQIFGEAAAKPIIAGSTLAKGELARIKQQTADRFFGALDTEVRGKLKARQVQIRKEQAAGGWTNQFEVNFKGLEDLREDDADVPAVIKSITNGLAYMRDVEGVLDTHEIIVGAFQEYATQNVQDDVEGVLQVGERMLDIPLATNTTIGTDKRDSVQVVRQIIASAREGVERMGVRVAQNRSRFSTELDLATSETVAVILEEDPLIDKSLLFDKTVERLQEDKLVTALMDGAEIDALSERNLASIKSMIEGGEGRDTARIREELAQMDRDGASEQEIEDTALALLPVLEFRKWRREKTTNIWSKIGQNPQAAYLLRVTGADALPEELSDELTAQLNFMQNDAKGEIIALALGAEDDNDPNAWANGEKARTIFTGLRASFREITDGIDKSRDDFALGNSLKDIAQMDLALGDLRGKIAPSKYRELVAKRNTVVTATDNRLFQVPEFNTTLRQLPILVKELAAQQELDEIETSKLVASVTGRFFSESRALSRNISGFPVEERSTQSAKAISIASETALESVMTPKQIAASKEIKGLGIREGSRLEKENANYAIFDRVGSMTRAIEEDFIDPPEILDEPGSVRPFFGSITQAQVYQRSLNKVAIDRLARMFSGERSAEQEEREWVQLAAIGGAFSAEEIASGKGSIRVMIPRREIRYISNANGLRSPYEFTERMISAGFELKKHMIVVGRDGLVFYDEEFTKQVDLSDLSPTLTLYARSKEEFDTWKKNTPMTERRDFYKKRGLNVSDMLKADALEEKRQKRLRQRYER